MTLKEQAMRVVQEAIDDNIETCAKIAETMKSGPIYYVNGRPNAHPIIGGEHIAAAIRTLKGSYYD